MKQAGIAYATDQIIDLYANNVKNVHVYTMNKPDVAEKIMNMDFDLIEGSLGREKYQKAKNTLTYDGLYNYIDYYRFLFRGIIFIAVYGTITVKLNPWLILVLTGLSAFMLILFALTKARPSHGKEAAV